MNNSLKDVLYKCGILSIVSTDCLEDKGCLCVKKTFNVSHSRQILAHGCGAFVHNMISVKCAQ